MQLQIADISRCIQLFSSTWTEDVGASYVLVGTLHSNSAVINLHGTHELLVQRQSVPDGQISVFIQKQTEYLESLRCSLSNLIYVSNPAKFFIQGHP